MEEGDDPFSKAWETSPQSSTFPGAWSSAPQASGDPWGHKVKEEPWTSENGGELYHLDEHTKGTQQLNTVFQQCNINDTQSAIGNPRSNSHTHSSELNQSGFDDNFGEWSETDVLFKSGLLDQEFKTVSVTAEEDDLWSSADISALNLSLQSPSFTTQDGSQRLVEQSKISSIQEEFNVSNIDSSTRGGEINPSFVNVSFTTGQRAQNKPSRSVVSQEDDSILTGQVESGQVHLGGDSDIIEGDSSGPSITSNSSNSVTHSMLISTAGLDSTSSVSVQCKVSSKPPSLPGATVPSENTSIIPTQNFDASNSEASLSVNGGNRNSYSVGEVDKLSDSTLTHTGKKSIPLHISDTALRTFEDTQEKRIMGNILDSDKEEKDNMEAVDVDTQDKGEQTMPPDPEDKSAAPTVDLKESVAVKENGSDAMVNGEQGDIEIPLNDSLDTQTQTREDEFPPDDDYAEDIQLEAEPEKVVLAEENGVEENQDNVGAEEAAASDLPDVIEKEASSEGYGSQDADKTLDSENGSETIAPAEKEEEKVVSQDEGLASPENEDSNARLPSREEMGLRPVVPEEPVAETDQQDEPQSPQQKSFVQKEVKMREKKVNSRVVKQHRISFVEQEVLRQKQQEEEFRREREMRDQERSQALSPSPPSSTSGSNASSRLTSPTTPEPATKPAKAPVKQPPSKAKAVYQELQYNPKVGGGNRSSAMVRQWESKFKK